MAPTEQLPVPGRCTYATPFELAAHRFAPSFVTAARGLFPPMPAPPGPVLPLAGDVAEQSTVPSTKATHSVAATVDAPAEADAPVVHPAKDTNAPFSERRRPPCDLELPPVMGSWFGNTPKAAAAVAFAGSAIDCSSCPQLPGAVENSSRKMGSWPAKVEEKGLGP